MSRKLITVARARELFRYDPLTGVLYRRHAHGEKVGRAKSRGYLVIGVEGRQYSVHRLAWLLSYGKWPAGEIDHINGVKTDNRLENLRDVAHHVNARNRPDATKARLIGPVPVDGAWMVVLPHYQSTTTAGPFETHAEAHDYFARHYSEAKKHEGQREPKLRLPNFS